MAITERQEKILKEIVKEYIERAEPVSSELLNKKYNLKVCSATVRNEMHELTEEGYLEQPHISAGRVPTSKGYRFFVDSFLELNKNGLCSFEDFEEVERRREEILDFANYVTRRIALESSNLVLACFGEREFVWEDGWKEVFQNPEFREGSCLKSFVKTVEELEQDIKDLNIEELSDLDIYIGREKSFLKSKDFSLMISRSVFPETERGILAILGPKRMAYDKNISLIHSLIEKLNRL